MGFMRLVSGAGTALCLMMLATACMPRRAEDVVASEPAATPAGPATAQPALPAVVHVWRPEWSGHVAQAIDRHSPELLRLEKLPLGEIRAVCPGFVKADARGRSAFWALFLAAVARYESGFDPEARFTEGWKDPETGLPQQSEGLLQLSYSDRQGHPDCALARKPGNITDPEVNLACGVAILRRQLAARKTLWPAPKPYYWSVLTNKKTKAKVASYLAANVASVEACR